MKQTRKKDFKNFSYGYFIWLLIVFQVYACTINGTTIIAVNSGDWDVSSNWAALQTGTITVTNGSATVTGASTAFNSDLGGYYKIYTDDGTYIGQVETINSDTDLTLTTTATFDYTGDIYSIWASDATETGRITSLTTSTAVDGDGSTVFTDYKQGTDLYYYDFGTGTITYAGTINTITDDVNLNFYSNATSDETNSRFKQGGIPEYGDDVTIPAGITITVNSSEDAANLTIDGGNLNIETGGELNLTSTLTSQNLASVTVDVGSLIVSGNVSIDSSEVYATNSATVNIGGSFTVANSGSADINTSSTITVSGDITVESSTITIDNANIATTSGDFYIDGGTLNAENSNINVYDDLFISNGGDINTNGTTLATGGDIDIATGSSLDLDAGTVTVGGTLSVDASTFTATNGADVNIASSFSATTGSTIDINTSSEVTVAGNISFGTSGTASTVTIDNAILSSTSGNLTVDGANMTVQNGASVSIDGSTTTSNSGSISLISTTLSTTALNVNSSSTFDIDGGTLTLTGDTSTGNLSVDGGTFTTNEDITVPGTFTLAGGSNLALSGISLAVGVDILIEEASTASFDGTIVTTSTGDFRVSDGSTATISNSCDFDIAVDFDIENGNLTVTNSTIDVAGVFYVGHNGSEAADIILNADAVIRVSVNLLVEGGGSSIIIQEGAELYVDGDLGDNNQGNITFENYGFVEVFGSLSCIQMDVYNYESGVLVIHGDIEGAGSGYEIHNYGTITVDNDVTFYLISFYNYTTGTLLIYGDAYIQGSGFENFGLIQANNVEISSWMNFINFYCEALTGTVTTSTSSTTVTGVGTSFLSELQPGDIIATDDCDAIGTVLSVTSDTELELQYEAYSPSLTDTNLYLSVPGTIIALDTLKSIYCMGCQNYNQIGNLYYSVIDVSGAYCSATGAYITCEDWLATLSNVKTVSIGRRLWLAADYLGYTVDDGEGVYRWFDLANQFGFKMSQSTEDNMPILKNNATDNLNYNPVMRFDEVDANYIWMDLDSNYLYSEADDAGFAMMAVVVPKAGETDQLVFDFGLYPTEGYGLMYSDINAKAYTATDAGGAENSMESHGRSTAPTLITQTTSWNGNQILYLDGEDVDTKTVTLTELDTAQIAGASTASTVEGPFTLGKNSTSLVANDFDGDIAEVIVYARTLAEKEKNATEAFLALKYGITLAHDYLANDTTTVIYDIDGTYDYCVAGLAREDLNLLHQRQTKSLSADAVLTVATDNFVAVDQSKVATRIENNTSYLIWGNDANATITERVYKIIATNFYQEVVMAFNISGLDAGNLPDLLIADDEGFSKNLTTVTPDSYSNDSLIYRVTFDNNQTSYFTFFYAEPVYDPGVGIGTTDIDSTAALHIESHTQGVLINKMTTENMNSITNPANGLLIYNTTLNSFMYNAGTPAAPSWSIVGRPEIEDLSGVKGNFKGEMRMHTDNTMYYWTGTQWIQLSVTGDTDPTP